MHRRSFLQGMILSGLGAFPLFAENSPRQAAQSPRPGTPMRKAILDGLRGWVREHHRLDVLFLVQTLRFRKGWAWVVATPRSKSGEGQYETISALLREGDGCWAVVAVLPTECSAADDPERACDAAFRNFKDRVTGSPLFVPPEIFVSR